MDFWASFWDIIWWFLWAFIFIAYLMALFSIITDLFRDRTLSGGGKAVWLVFLLFLPLLAALVYLIARGRGMAERSYAASSAARQETESYIREVAGGGPAEEISKAKALLDSGVITRAEFDQLKATALRGDRAEHHSDGMPRPEHV